MSAGRNGGEDYAHPRPPVVPLNVDEREALRHYGTIAVQYNAVVEKELPAIKDAIDEATSSALAACGMAKEARDIARETQELLKRYIVAQGKKDLIAEPAPPLPPMREKTTSSVEFIERVKVGVLDEMRKEASKTAGPEVTTKPENIARVVEDRLNAELAKRDQEARLKRLDQLDADAKEKDAWRKSAQRQVLVAVVIAAILGIGGSAVAYLKGHETGVTLGHQDGFYEGQRAGREQGTAPAQATERAMVPAAPAAAAPAK